MPESTSSMGQTDVKSTVATEDAALVRSRKMVRVIRRHEVDYGPVRGASPSGRPTVSVGGSGSSKRLVRRCYASGTLELGR